MLSLNNRSIKLKSKFCFPIGQLCEIISMRSQISYIIYLHVKPNKQQTIKDKTFFKIQSPLKIDKPYYMYITIQKWLRLCSIVALR